MTTDAITLEQLRIVCPTTPVGRLTLFVEPISAALAEFEVNTRARVEIFLAQYAHETEGFTRLEENLHYTHAEVIWKTFQTHFSDEDDAAKSCGNPERLANRVYAFRYGNGAEASGDGWKYRGRGLPHLTFYSNYERAGRALELDLLNQPELLLEPGPAARAGGWFWQDCHGNRFADNGDFDGATKVVNGGLNGLASRYTYLGRVKRALVA